MSSKSSSATRIVGSGGNVFLFGIPVVSMVMADMVVWNVDILSGSDGNTPYLGVDERMKL